MDSEEAEQLLDQGFSIGFTKPTDDPAYLGWITISKVKPSSRLLEVLSEDEAPDAVREERRRQREPYLVLVVELRRDVHESGDYETESDYRQKDRHWFSDLSAAARLLESWGYSLRDAREARELDAP
jgi:hypothetical protein